MLMAVQSPHPLKSTTEDDSAHICQPHIKNITQRAFFHLKNISRLQSCISDGMAEALGYASTSDLEHCSRILPGSSSKAKNSAAAVLNETRQHINRNHHHDSLAPSKVPSPTNSSHKGRDSAPHYPSDLLKLYTSSCLDY